MVLRLPIALAMVSVLMVGTSASAAIVPGTSLGAQDIVDAFNSANGGRGLYFEYMPNHLGRIVQKTNDLTRTFYDFADVSAYTQGMSAGKNHLSGAEYFFSFCIEPLTSAPPSSSRGYLNFSDKKTVAEHTGEALMLGAAYLYAHWSLETLPGFNYNAAPEDDEYAVLCQTIRGFAGAVAIDENDPFVQLLLSVNNDLGYWMQTYNPDAYYTEIGEYCVFVMNVYHMDIDGASYQNQLYLVKGNLVPEPATMTLLALGGLAALRRRTRR